MDLLNDIFETKIDDDVTQIKPFKSPSILFQNAQHPHTV